MGLSIIALLYGPDQPGIVARVSGWIYQRGGNVLHADQHLDRQENVFFQRVEWELHRTMQIHDVRVMQSARKSVQHDHNILGPHTSTNLGI